MSKVTARRKILDAAQQLMTGKGYSATTVDQIIDIAGVAKGSFYHSFKSKEDLAIAALTDYASKGMAIVAQGDYVSIEDPVERALSFLTYVEEQSQLLWSHGCLLGSVVVEVADTYPSVRKEIDQLFQGFEVGFTAILGPALKARNVTSVSAEQLSVHLLGVIEGSIIAARSHQCPKYLEQGIAMFRQYVELLLEGSSDTRK